MCVYQFGGNLLVAFALGLFQTQVEVAVAAADGDLNVAVEILMTQQVCILTLICYSLLVIIGSDCYVIFSG